MIGFVSDPHQTKNSNETCTGSTLTKGSIRGIPRCCNPVDIDDDIEEKDDDDQAGDDVDEKKMMKRMLQPMTSSASASPSQPSMPPLSTGKTH